jgi:hypothetical protein
MCSAREAFVTTLQYILQECKTNTMIRQTVFINSLLQNLIAELNENKAANTKLQECVLQQGTEVGIEVSASITKRSELCDCRYIQNEELAARLVAVEQQLETAKCTAGRRLQRPHRTAERISAPNTAQISDVVQIGSTNAHPAAADHSIELRDVSEQLAQVRCQRTDEEMLSLRLRLAETQGLLAGRDEERLVLRSQVTYLQDLLGRALLRQGSRSPETGGRVYAGVSSAAYLLHACILQLQNVVLFSIYRYTIRPPLPVGAANRLSRYVPAASGAVLYDYTASYLHPVRLSARWRR